VKYFKAIAAMSLNRVIGNGNRIPWHIPEDFKWFKQVTTGHTLVMGRKTFESIGRPLPNRKTIVLSRTRFDREGVEWKVGLDQIDPSQEPGETFICGGGDIYRQGLPLCSDLYLTLVKREVEGDVFFPEFESQWILHSTLRETHDFNIFHYANPRCMSEGPS
jgi:dihydrofolate reductase